jgi:F-type H+-transporting ATPase subunit b
MKINGLDILGTIINFFILLAVLKHFFFDKVNNMLTLRNEEIKNNINSAEDNKKKAELLRLENEEKLKDAKLEGKKIVENFKVKADKVSDDIVKVANQEAGLIMERARVEAERERERLKDEVKTQAVDLAILLSSKALEEAIDEKQHRRLIEDFIAKVGI